MNCGLLEDAQLVSGRARTRAQAVGEVRASGVIVSVCVYRLAVSVLPSKSLLPGAQRSQCYDIGY